MLFNHPLWKKKEDAHVLLETLMPSPADVGLNPDSEG
jgi:hypothetical protein